MEPPSSPSPPDAAGGAERPAFVKQRLRSLDAYRGLIMITLSFAGFGLAATAKNHLRADADASFWQVVQYQFSHAQWVGCSYWDLIQPSFMFMVGVSMAYSYAKRQRLGHSYRRMLGHAAWRSLVLIFLGIFLISNWRGSTNWSLMNVLTQMGLGYTFLFLLWGRTFRTQTIAAAAILAGTWLLYMLYPGSGLDAASGAPQVGVKQEWAQQHLAGIGAAWHKNANVGHAIDLWLLNLLPQKDNFTFNAGGYQTINFIPSLATMLFGLMCGELLRSRRSAKPMLQILIVAGVSGLIAGQLLHWTGICPLVKRIWTPSWTLFSTGWCCLILATLYGLIDMLNFRRWAFPLVVVGLNSIAIYCMGMLLKPWTARTLETHLGQDIFIEVGRILPLGEQYEAYEPTVQAVMVGLVFWLICWWLHRQKIFLRI